MSKQYFQSDVKAQTEHNENYDDVLKKDTGLAPIRDGEMHRMNAEDRATALQLAQLADPGPPIRSMRSVAFVGIVLVVCMCSGDNGMSSEQDRVIRS